MQSTSICTQCHISFIPKSGSTGKFCCKSCAATYNNAGKKRGIECRQKISAKLKQLQQHGTEYWLKRNQKRSQNIQIFHCIICKTVCAYNRKTCSPTCLKVYQKNRASEHLRKNRHKYVGPHQRSWMERSFVEWLESHGIHQGIYGYKDQVHFKYKLNNKTKNGWADFVFVSRKLIIELDGNHHNKRKDLDQLRDAHLLQERGYTVVRITHAEYRKQSRIEEIKNLLDIKPCN